MRRLLHPLSILSLATLPFVLYSVRRSGYELWQFISPPLSASLHVCAGVALAVVVVICAFRYQKTQRKVFSAATAVAVATFLALQATEEYPLDYKLWIYIVAPVLAWAVLLSSAVILALHKMRKI